MEKSQRGTKLSIIFALLLVLGISLQLIEAAPQEYLDEYYRDVREAPCPGCPADQPDLFAARSLLPIEQEYPQASHYVTRSIPPAYHHPAPAGAYEPPVADPLYDASALTQPPSPVQQSYYYPPPAHPLPPAGQPAAAQQTYSQAPDPAAPAHSLPYDARHYAQAQRVQPAQPEPVSYISNRLQPPQPEAASYVNNRLPPPPQPEAASYMNNRNQPPQAAQPAPSQHNLRPDPQQVDQVPAHLSSPASSQRQPASQAEVQSYLNAANNQPPLEQSQMQAQSSNGNQRPAAPPALPESRFFGNPNSRHQPSAVPSEARAYSGLNGRHPPPVLAAPPAPPRYRYHPSNYYQPPSSFRSFNYNPYSMPEYQASMYAGYGRNELEEDDEELAYAKYPRSSDDALRIEQPAQPAYLPYEDRRNPYTTFRQYSKDGSIYDNRSRGGDKLYVVYRADQSDSDLESVVRQAIDIARQQRAQDRYRYERAYMLSPNEEEEDAQPVIWTRQDQTAALNQATSNDRYDLSAGKVFSTDGQYVLESDQKDRTKWIAVPTKTLENTAVPVQISSRNDKGEVAAKNEPSEKLETDKQMDFVEDMELPLTPTEPSNFDRPAETTTST